MAKNRFYSCYIYDQFLNRRYLGTLIGKNKKEVVRKFMKKFGLSKKSKIKIVENRLHYK